MGSMKYPTIDTIGLEIEVENLSQRKLQNEVNPALFSMVHDASIESNSPVFGNIPIVVTGGGRIPNVGTSTIGTELVSIPMVIEGNFDLLSHLKEVTNILIMNGEPLESFRASTHVHVNIPWNLQILKNIMILGGHLEDLFFRIGGMGSTFRGLKVNNSQFCRPITLWGPQCAEGRNGVFQLFNIEDLLRSRTTSGFWNRYGGINITNSQVSRYHPVRYTWLNLYSLLYHGTLEFRVFNKNLNPQFILAIIDLCQSFSRTILKELPENLEMNSVFISNGNQEERFENMIELLDISESKTLRTIFNRSKEVVLEEGYIYSHLNRDTRYNFNRYQPKIVTNVSRFEIADIHHINRGSQYLEDNVSRPLEEGE